MRGELLGKPLSPSELNALRLAAFGISWEEVAKQMNTTVRVVKNYACNAYLKLGVSGHSARLLAIKKALELGLIKKSEIVMT